MGLNRRFAATTMANGLVFTKKDMQRFALTLTENIMRPSGDWAVTVEGQGKMVRSRLHEGILGWALLHRWDESIPRRLDTMLKEFPKAFPLGWFSYATGPIVVGMLLKQRNAMIIGGSHLRHPTFS